MNEKTPPPNALGGANESKEKPKRTVEFLIGGVVKSFDRDTVMKDYDVVNIVRMQPDDFPKIDRTPGSQFAHFNLTNTDNEPGKKYLIVRIESSAPGREPVLSLDEALIAECDESIEHLSYDELTPKQLESSLEGMRDVPSLQDAMVKRYSRSGLSREEILERGIGYTLFKIMGSAPASNVAR